MAEDKKHQRSGFINGFSRRSLRYSGITMLLFPIWGPIADGEGLGWPHAEDFGAFAVAIIGGLVFLLWSTRGGD